MKRTLLLFLLASQLSTAQYFGIPVDKTEHILAGGAVSATSYHVFYRITNSPNKAFMYSLLTTILVGTAKEIIDKQRGGIFDPKDLGATVIGGLSVNIPLNIFDKCYKKCKKKEAR